MRKRKKRAVVLDDDPDAIFDWVREAGSHRRHLILNTFNDVDDALRFVKKEPPDVIFTDYHIPGTHDGDHIIRFKEIGADINIVCYSTNESEAVRKSAYDNGASYFFVRKDEVVKDVQVFRQTLGYWLSAEFDLT